MRLGVSALVLALIFHVLPLQDVIATIRKVALRDWLLTLGIFLVGHTVSAWKWELLVSSGAGFLVVLRAHFAGLVANLYLPGVAGGDVVRAAILFRKVSDKSRLALGSVADRLIDTIGLLLIAAVGLLFAIRQIESGATLLAWVAMVLVAFVGGGAVAVKFHPLALRYLPVGGKLSRIAHQLSASVVVLAGKKRRLLLCLVLSLAVQSAFIGATIGLARSAGVEAPVAAWFFAWPLSKLIATLPISIAGIGVREAGLAGFLTPFGAPAAAVVGIGLLWQTVQLSGALLGGLVLLLFHRVFGSRLPPGSINGDANGLR